MLHFTAVIGLTRRGKEEWRKSALFSQLQLPRIYRKGEIKSCHLLWPSSAGRGVDSGEHESMNIVKVESGRRSGKGRGEGHTKRANVDSAHISKIVVIESLHKDRRVCICGCVSGVACGRLAARFGDDDRTDKAYSLNIRRRFLWNVSFFSLHFHS